jgi:type II secretory pathway predicted ATPase ExeA
MYRKHFGLTHFPFELALQPDALFVSGAIAEAETRLRHLLELRAVGLVTGEVGSGKTTVCRKVAAALHPGLHRVFHVPLSTGNVLDMYKCIAWELGGAASGLPAEHSRAAAFRAVRAEVTRLTLEAKQRAVLIIDEAHHLRNEVLEDLRLLTNYEMDSDNRLCLLLVGLTELRRRLAMAVHESLAQRVVVRYHLAGLSREETPEYLVHRLRLAGCELPLFEPPAVEALFQASRGMPRQVNRLAHYALSAAAIAKARAVASDHVQAALEELAP